MRTDYSADYRIAVCSIGLMAEQELLRAIDRFAPMHSPHEGIAVIEEEYLELREHVHGNTGRSVDAIAEAVQLAAMAMRYVLDLRGRS